jgi:hypothetical protein
MASFYFKIADSVVDGQKQKRMWELKETVKPI